MAGPQRYLTAVELVLLFTPRLVGNNAGVHPIARGIEPLLHGSRFRNLLHRCDERSPKKMTFDKHSFLGATIELSAPRLKLRTGGARLEGSEAYRVTIM